MRRGTVGMLLGVVATLAAAPAARAAGFSATLSTPISGLSVPQGLAAGDLNGDGLSDLVVANAGTGELVVNTNHGGGAFTSQSLVVGGVPVAVALGDLNNDGRQDIASVSIISPELDLYVSNALGSYDPQVFDAGQRPTSVAIGDLNGDGFKDIAVSDAAADDDGNYDVLLYTYNATTHGYDQSTLLNFADAGLGGPGGVAIGDLNGDGRNDIATANGSNDDGNTVTVFTKNAGAGYTKRFLSIPGRHAAISIAIGDLGGSGPGADIAAAFNAGTPDSVGTWIRDASDPTGYRGQALIAPTSADIPAFNGIAINRVNGRPAVASANQVGANVTVWTQDQAGFTPTVIAMPEQATGIAAADFDGDGRTDFATSLLNTGRIGLLTNSTPPAVSAAVGGTVPATLSLTLGPAATFGAFTPGADKTYTTSATANVISTAGDATLSASDPGHLANGTFTLPDPLQVTITPAAWTGPVSNAPVTIGFSQHVGSTDALRTGSYTRSLTFTLSTTTP